MANYIGVWAELPSELEFLVPLALRFGCYQTDEERLHFLQVASPAEIRELEHAAVRCRAGGLHNAIGEFFDRFPIVDYAESAKLFFLFATMNAAGLKTSPEGWNTVHEHIKSLSRFGSYRLASERAIAARFLADMGEQARPAIAALRKALGDEDLRVRVWAHYALAVIEGDRAEHEATVRDEYAKHGAKDAWGYHVEDVGMEASEVLARFHSLDSVDVHIWRPDDECS